ncbi:hypothetical protein [[Pseudomonas] boreopolis]|uniref:hypothetical protein n=1 Tax=Xanthomonas boreopolis TaxID=86183 RepID=UPI003D4A97D2
MKKFKAVLASAMILASTFSVVPAFATPTSPEASAARAEGELRCGVRSDGTVYCEVVVKW